MITFPRGSSNDMFDLILRHHMFGHEVLHSSKERISVRLDCVSGHALSAVPGETIVD